MIIAGMDDPAWLSNFLKILLDKKLEFIEQSLANCKFDIIETGGGAASSTVISPNFYRQFCLPYDRAMHDALHRVGHIATYHTCGGMIGLIDLIIENGTDASETLSPVSVGGNITDRDKVKKQLGSKCALIGGIDQFNILTSGTEEQIRQEVTNLFQTYGKNGGYIMSTADHFFDAPPENLQTYANTAQKCLY